MKKMKLSKIFWLFPFIFFIAGYFSINQIFSHKKEINIPYLIGSSVIDGIKILSDLNLNLRILTQKEEPDLIPGTIITQNPVNQKVKQNQTVYVAISKKPDFFKMPDFKSKKLNEINKELSKVNIKPKIYYLESIYPENYCIAQFPVKNETTENKKVILYISTGNNKEIIFPDLKNNNLKKVIEIFAINNIKTKIVLKNSNEIYNDQKDYTIIDQRPFPGSLIKLNSNLIVKLIIE